jgi:hypothetical protein
LNLYRENTSDCPEVGWSEIQPSLGHYDSDVLVILDCCYASQAARSESPIPRNVELMAACGMNTKTVIPGKKSFTTIFIQEVKDALAKQQTVKISDIHRKLSSKDSGFFQSPIHFSLGSHNSSICLEPQGQIATIASRSSEDVASLTLRFSMRGVDEMPEVIKWIKRNPPRVISKVEVQHIANFTNAVLNFVQDNDLEGRSAVRFNKLSSPAQDDVHSAWTSFSAPFIRLAALTRLSMGSVQACESSAASADTDLSDLCVKDIHDGVKTLQNSIERNTMSIADLFNNEVIEKAIEDETVMSIGLGDTLRLRKVAQTPPVDGSLRLRLGPNDIISTSQFKNITIQPQFAQLGQVIVEARQYGYDQSTEKRILELSLQHMEKIARLLEASKSGEFHTLTCVRYFHEAQQRRYGLVFKIPEMHQTSEIFSLRTILQRLKENERPSLGQRFGIAANIGRALLKWHLVGWVHQGIASHNIHFFREKKSKKIDYNRPYLFGFEYSRENDAPSTLARVEDFALNVYRHPARQGVPSKHHKKTHDLYAFGIVLLELGMWKIVESFFTTAEKNDITASDMHTKILSIAEKSLSHLAGSPYQKATMICLQEDFRVRLDDNAESRLAKAFEELVLKPVELGCVFDRDDTNELDFSS